MPHPGQPGGGSVGVCVDVWVGVGERVFVCRCEGMSQSAQCMYELCSFISVTTVCFNVTM